MLFMTYKPKTAKNVKAEQVTEKNLEEISTAFFGMAVVVDVAGEKVLKIATFDGPIDVFVGDWVVRTEDGLVKMTDEEFNKMYERARNVREN